LALHAESLDTHTEDRRRSHLANDRTFLAWLRTGLTIIALGMASAQFLERKSASSPVFIFLLSTLLAGTGLAMMAIGWHRYHQVRGAIDSDEPHVHAGVAVAGIAFAAIMAGFISIIILVLIEF